MADSVPDHPNPAIEVRVKTVGQLFNSFDPSPFRERDLDDDAEEFIVDWARELPEDQPLRIVIHLPEAEIAKCEKMEVPSAVANHFAYRGGVLQKELSELFRTGRRHLVVGLSVFVSCVLLSQLVQQMAPPGAVTDLVRESLIIVGWVANWKPIEILLYDWWPVRRRIRLYRRLAETPVTVAAD